MIRIEKINANATIVHTSRASVLVSYSTPVAAYILGRGYVRTNQFHSVTTSRHINKWLAGAEAEAVPQAELDALM